MADFSSKLFEDGILTTEDLMSTTTTMVTSISLDDGEEMRDSSNLYLGFQFLFWENETVEAAIMAIGKCTDGGIPVWKKRQQKGSAENSEMRQQRFGGIVNSLDIVAFLAREDCLRDQEKVVDPGTSSSNLQFY